METPKLFLLMSMVVLKVLLQNGSRMVRSKRKLFITLANWIVLIHLGIQMVVKKKRETILGVYRTVTGHFGTKMVS